MVDAALREKVRAFLRERLKIDASSDDPETELRLLRDVLFEKFANEPRFRPIGAAEVNPSDPQSAFFCSGDVDSLAMISPAATLERLLVLFTRLVDETEDAKVAVRYHEGYASYEAACGNGPPAALRFSAKVDVEWGGRWWTREYALDFDPLPRTDDGCLKRMSQPRAVVEITEDDA